MCLLEPLMLRVKFETESEVRIKLKLISMLLFITIY